MPDPTTGWRGFRSFRDLVIWRLQREGRPRPNALALDMAMPLLKALADDFYEAALDSVVEIRGEAFPRALLHTGPALIAIEVVEVCRPELIQTVELRDLTLRFDIILTRRWTGGQYRNLRFRLRRPAAFAEYLAGRPRQPPSIGDHVLVTLLLEDPVFQHHRDERRLPRPDLLRDVTKLRYPEFAVPGDDRLRAVLGHAPRDEQRGSQRPDARVVAMYGEPQTGPPPTWERDLYFAEIGHDP
jgi:hypothetical protein